MLDFVGERYGKLVVLEKVNKRRIYWRCLCDCGNEKLVRNDALRAKNKPTRSCGCLGTNSTDLTGKRFNKLLVLGDSEERTKSGKVIWNCSCDCGNETKVDTSNLKNAISCGCESSKASNLVGRRFGKLVVLSRDGTKGRSKTWNCKCDCGGEKVVTTNHLTTGNTTSCGCKSTIAKTLIGERFGDLEVIKDSGKREKGGARIYECKCDCGNITYSSVSNLRSGRHKTCGCSIINPYLTAEDRMKNRYELGGNSVVSWRKKIFERDDYTCQVCNARNGNGKKYEHNAHHLDGWNWNKKGRFDIENGITLCTGCHRKFHKEYGMGDNTKEQFREFYNATLKR